MFTYYDGATGERTELSRRTVLNWTAKSANYLLYELGLSSGDLVAVRLPIHWLTGVIVLGCWAAGLRTTFEPGPAEAAAVFGAPGAPDQPVYLAVDLDRPALAAAAAGGFAADVLACPDDFADAAEPGQLLHQGGGEAWTARRLCEAAQEAGSVGRILCLAGLDEPAGFRAGLLASLGGAGSVLCRRVTAEEVKRIATTERVRATAGTQPPGMGVGQA